MAEFAGVLWYSNDVLKVVRNSLGQENTLSNIVRFVYNHPDLYLAFIFCYPDIKMLQDANEAGEFEDVRDEQGDRVCAFDGDPKYRGNTWYEQDGCEYVEISWEE
jgi:hypothetical protein